MFSTRNLITDSKIKTMKMANFEKIFYYQLMTFFFKLIFWPIISMISLSKSSINSCGLICKL